MRLLAHQTGRKTRVSLDCTIEFPGDGGGARAPSHAVDDSGPVPSRRPGGHLARRPASAEFFWPAILSELAERGVNATVTCRLTQNRFWSARGCAAGTRHWLGIGGADRAGVQGAGGDRRRRVDRNGIRLRSRVEKSSDGSRDCKRIGAGRSRCPGDHRRP